MSVSETADLQAIPYSHEHIEPEVARNLEPMAPRSRARSGEETEWMYIYKIGSKSGFKLSKFWDESFEVGSAALRQRWPMMSEDERLEFGFNWSSKSAWNDNDTEILEIIMEVGNDKLWTSCTFAFTRHPDRDRAVSFLVERLQNYEGGNEPLNYFQALGILKDSRAARAIRPYYEKYRKAVETETAMGVPDDVVFGPIPYFQYLCACGALVKVDGPPEYEQAIRKCFDHPSEQVRYWAEHVLEIEGPTTARRNAEYKKKYSKQ
jgi:hypothetical protein